MRNAAMVLLGAVLAMAPGCATIMSQGKAPSKWPVTIDSDPPGADIVVRNHCGEVAARGKAPLKATLDSKSTFIGIEAYLVEATMPGFDQGEWSIVPTSNPWVYGNWGFALGAVLLLPVAPELFLVGILVAPGAYVTDLITGAAFPIEDHYVVPLARTNGGR